MLFIDFQNDANNDKVYAFGIKIEDKYKYLSPLFISEVWNDFINIKQNFIYSSSSTYYPEIKDLNKLYNIYYQLNLESISLIFGPKVFGKKKYLKIKDVKDVKNNKLTKNRFNKSENQKGHINAYLRNYPNNNPNQNSIELASNNNNEEKPLLGKKSSFFKKFLNKMGF